MKHIRVVALDGICLVIFLLGISSLGVDSFFLEQRQPTVVNGRRPIPTRFDTSPHDWNRRYHALKPSQLISLLRQGRDNEAPTIITRAPPGTVEGNNADDSSDPSETLSTTTTTPEGTKENIGTSSIPGIGLIVLCSVPLVWGTYVPIVRLLYEIDPPIPGFLFSAFYFFISSVTTISLSNILDNTTKKETGEKLLVKRFPAKEKEELLAGLELGSWYVVKLQPRKAKANS
eukprot:scaffold353_cov185-Amphora_coffeaeformis.AAC.33